MIETYAIICVGIAALIYGIRRVLSKHSVFNVPTLWIVIIMVVCEILGVFFMIYGNYNLSKILVTIGILTILIGYLTIYTYVFCRDIINFTNNIIESENKKDINLILSENFKLSKGIYVLFFIGWVIIINRNGYSFQKHIGPFIDALSEEKALGTFT